MDVNVNRVPHTAARNRWWWFSYGLFSIQFDFLILFYFCSLIFGHPKQFDPSVDRVPKWSCRELCGGKVRATEHNCIVRNFLFLSDFVGAVQIQFPFYIALV